LQKGHDADVDSERGAERMKAIGNYWWECGNKRKNE
jgi:hypothetical protein